MSTDIKFSKTQISNVIQSHGSFGYWIISIWRKSGKGAVRAGK